MHDKLQSVVAEKSLLQNQNAQLNAEVTDVQVNIGFIQLNSCVQSIILDIKQSGYNNFFLLTDNADTNTNNKIKL